MKVACTKVVAFLDERTTRTRNLANQLRRNRLPQFLQRGNAILGKYEIKEIVSFNEIFAKKLQREEMQFKDQATTIFSSQPLTSPQVASSVLSGNEQQQMILKLKLDSVPGSPIGSSDDGTVGAKNGQNDGLSDFNEEEDELDDGTQLTESFMRF